MSRVRVDCAWVHQEVEDEGSEGYIGHCEKDGTINSIAEAWKSDSKSSDIVRLLDFA